jgi:hypothetical protein
MIVLGRQTSIEKDRQIYIPMPEYILSFEEIMTSSPNGEMPIEETRGCTSIKVSWISQSGQWRKRSRDVPHFVFDGWGDIIRCPMSEAGSSLDLFLMKRWKVDILSFSAPL